MSLLFSGDALLLWAVFAPLLAAAAAPWLGRALRAGAGYVLALAFAPALALLTRADAARSGQAHEAALVWVETIGLELAFRADGFSLLFALLVAGIGLLILLYAAAYLGAKERHGRFYGYLLFFGGAMLGLVLADNLIALFAFWELTSISSFLLIGFWDARRASQDGAQKALLVTASGGLALLVAVILSILALGTVRLSEMDAAVFQASPYFVPAVICFLIAAFTKSAQLPFHLWLPTAMEAPTPVSAYLHSATMVKAGVILVAKLGFLFAGTTFAELTLYVGLFTMVWGSYLALRQHDLKALLAYSTVSQLGLLTALYGAGYTFAATAHLVNHAAFKAALFMVVGIIDHETKSRDLRKLSGLVRKLPFTFVLALPATLSMAGLPPLGGFISKELFYEEMLRAGLLPIILAVVGSVMTFAYSLKFLKVFFGPYRCENPKVHEAAPLFWLPALPLSLATVLFGLLPLSLSGDPLTTNPLTTNFLTSATVATYFTDLAQPSFGYEAGSLYLWHGLNTALALSVLTWFFGAALFVSLAAFLRVQDRLIPGWNMNTLYYGAVNGLERLSSRVTKRTQGGSFAGHLRLILLPAALLGFLVLWRFVPSGLTPVPLEFLAPALAILVGTGGVLRSRSRLSAIIFAGIIGVGSMLAFVLLSAPDLALTQLLIETVTIILFLSVFRFLPELTRYERPRPVALMDALLSLGVAFTVFAAITAARFPVHDRIQDYFLAYSKTLGGGYNVVNVILVDFRGYDTLGEIVVLGVVAVAVFALLRFNNAVERAERAPKAPAPQEEVQR